MFDSSLPDKRTSPALEDIAAGDDSDSGVEVEIFVLNPNMGESDADK